MTSRIATVLVVEADPVERDRFASWLEDEGRDVIVCPGPVAPDYTCVGSREGTCPLVSDAGIVVLDMSTEAEALMTGVASEELLALYLFAGRGVVALGSYSAEGIPGQLARLHRHPERDELFRAVRSLEAPTTASLAGDRSMRGGWRPWGRMGAPGGCGRSAAHRRRRP